MLKMSWETENEITLKLGFVTCAACGTPFGIEEGLLANLRKNGQSFYCPNGHSQWFGESEESKLKKKLEAEKLNTEAQKQLAARNMNWYREENARVEKLKRSTSALRGVVTRTKNKIAKGICPCCNTYFPDLHQHMTEAHPDFEQTQEVPVIEEETADSMEGRR